MVEAARTDPERPDPTLWLPPLPLWLEEARRPSQASAQHPPAQVLLQHLVHTDPKRLVVEALPDVVLVDPEFSCSHGFPFRDLGEIKPELSMVVARVEKLFVVFHWEGKNTQRHRPLISDWLHAPGSEAKHLA